MPNDLLARRTQFEKKKVNILGGYVTVTGHCYYIIVQSEDFAAITEFLPFCLTQTGDFVPVLTMDE